MAIHETDALVRDADMTSLVRERIDAVLTVHDILHYEDIKCAVSSHKIEYRVLSLKAKSSGALRDHVVGVINSLLGNVGAHCVVWRIRPELERGDDGWFRFYSRLHLLPASANDAFWVGVGSFLKEEGEPMATLETFAQ